MKLPVKYNEIPIQERRKVRNEYARLQGGACYFCKQPLDGPPSEEVANKYIKKHLFPRSFFLWPIHLHHSHKDGMTIGAVHNHCNAVLWQYFGE